MGDGMLRNPTYRPSQASRTPAISPFNIMLTSLRGITRPVYLQLAISFKDYIPGRYPTVAEALKMWDGGCSPRGSTRGWGLSHPQFWGPMVLAPRNFRKYTCKYVQFGAFFGTSGHQKWDGK